LTNKAVIEWLEIILNEYFGLPFLIDNSKSDELCVTLPSQIGMIKFDMLQQLFFSEGATLPCVQWGPESEKFNSILGFRSLPMPGNDSLPCPLIEQINYNHVIHYDILGLVYWMLSRQEEVGRQDLDKHGRFPATSSHAYKHKYLDRPIVDEWLNILGQVINRQWPKLQLKQHQPQLFVSCDVDRPYLPYSKSFLLTLKTLMGDLAIRKSSQLAINNVRRYFLFRLGRYELDPLMSAIEWIMHVNEKAGNKVAFYFITEQNGSIYNGCYAMDEGIIQYLLRRIHSSGHEIGLHGSYNSFNDREKIISEANVLRKTKYIAGVSQVEIGGRQHYLRWETPETARNLEAAGVVYDASLGYADRPGFRCGTCHEFRMFDPIKGEMLSIRQRPLVLMESSVISSIYMGLGYTDESISYMSELKQRCYKVGGNFSLLWHNSHLMTDEDKTFYLSLIGNEV